MIKRATVKLAFEDGAPLPTEFRLFTKGWNQTENGKFLFDDAAAISVMKSYAQWGIDLSIDLEHQMLDCAPGGPDATARDARGWCKLELRNGDLWATQARWTPDGAARLTNKTQRYVSPAFEADPETKRVLKMINIAITAMPATHKTPALVAARKATREAPKMDPELIKKALEAIANGDDEAATEILKGLIVSAAGGDAAGGDDAGSADDGAEGVPETEAVIDPKVVDNAADPAADPDDEEDQAPPKKAQRNAMRSMLRRLTDSKSFAEALAKVGEYRSSHMTLETERQKLSRERATMESAERRALVAELVKLGAEFPSTVWVDALAGAKTIKPRWAKMPIVELRSHVSEQRAARKAPKTGAGTQPPAGAEVAEVYELSAAELAICADTKCDPKDFAALKAVRNRDHVATSRLRADNARTQIAAAASKKVGN